MSPKSQSQFWIKSGLFLRYISVLDRLKFLAMAIEPFLRYRASKLPRWDPKIPVVEALTRYPSSQDSDHTTLIRNRGFQLWTLAPYEPSHALRVNQIDITNIFLQTTYIFVSDFFGPKKKSKPNRKKIDSEKYFFCLKKKWFSKKSSKFSKKLIFFENQKSHFLVDQFFLDFSKFPTFSLFSEISKFSK